MNDKISKTTKIGHIRKIDEFHFFFPDIPLIDLSNATSGSEGEILETAMLAQEGIKSMRKDRPYTGQPWTCSGIRGSQIVQGLTMRDIRDCYIRAYILSHPYYEYDEATKKHTSNRQEPNATLIDEAQKGVDAQLNGNDVYELVGSVDPIVVAQNLGVELERAMGIFPNRQLWDKQQEEKQ